jgi:hypothetical protein
VPGARHTGIHAAHRVAGAGSNRTRHRSRIEAGTAGPADRGVGADSYMQRRRRFRDARPGDSGNWPPMPRTSEIRRQGDAPAAAELRRARQIVDYAPASAKSLLAGYNTWGGPWPGCPERRAARPTPRDAALAGAGLDPCVQQLVRDALPPLASEGEEARQALVVFGARRPRRQSDTDAAGIDARFLAELIWPAKPSRTAGATVNRCRVVSCVGRRRYSGPCGRSICGGGRFAVV